MPDLEPVVGRYLNLESGGRRYRIYYEEGGEGRPLICLHTAGADSRQYRHVLNDAEITDRFRVMAFDLPSHGRSNPPDEWWLEKYRLTTDVYLGLIRDFWRALGLERPVVMGCSMGGAIVLKVAADHQDEIAGIVGLESTAFAEGRDNDFLHHPAIHGGELAACYTYGLNGPDSPEGGLPRELVVLQPVRPRRVQGRRLLLLRGLGRARRHQADRHQPLQGLAADRRIRLFRDAGHDPRGGRGDPGLPIHRDEGDRALPDGREPTRSSAATCSMSWRSWRSAMAEARPPLHAGGSNWVGNTAGEGDDVLSGLRPR